VLFTYVISSCCVCRFLRFVRRKPYYVHCPLSDSPLNNNEYAISLRSFSNASSTAIHLRRNQLGSLCCIRPRGCGVDRLSMSIHVPEDSNMTAGLLVKKAAQQRIYATSCQASFLLQNRPGSSSWKNHRSAWGIDMMKQYKSNAVHLQGPTVCTSSPHWNKMSLTLWLSFTGAPKLA
jgi:hypothetical protein